MQFWQISSIWWWAVAAAEAVTQLFTTPDITFLTTFADCCILCDVCHQKYAFSCFFPSFLRLPPGFHEGEALKIIESDRKMHVSGGFREGREPPPWGSYFETSPHGLRSRCHCCKRSFSSFESMATHIKIGALRNNSLLDTSTYTRR